MGPFWAWLHRSHAFDTDLGWKPYCIAWSSITQCHSCCILFIAVVIKAHQISRKGEITPHLVGSDHDLKENVGLELSLGPFLKIKSTMFAISNWFVILSWKIYTDNYYSLHIYRELSLYGILTKHFKGIISSNFHDSPFSRYSATIPITELISQEGRKWSYS